MKRLIASVRGKIINEEHLDPAFRTAEIPVEKPPIRNNVPAPDVTSPHFLPAALEALERRMIENALRESAGNKPKAAQARGLSRQGLIKKLKRWDVSTCGLANPEGVTTNYSRC